MSTRADLPYSPAWRRGTELLLPGPIRAIMKRDWHGQENIPRQGGVIIAPNHLSYADWAAVALFVHQRGRYPAFMIKSPVFDVKVIGPFLRKCGQLPVHREQQGAALVVKELKDAEQRLRDGECLIVYPEGTASRDPDMWPMVGKTGAARLALVTGAPVIPVAHWGAELILPYGSKKPSLVPRHLVKMLAGPPVDLSAYAGRPIGREVLRGATAAIMADITALLARLRGEQAPAVPYDLAAARRAQQTASGQTDPPGDPPPPAAARA